MNDPHSNKTKLFISAGERSGDIHSSELVKELKKQSGHGISFSGLGGEFMKAEGVELLYTVKDLAVTGLVEVASKYPFFKKVLRDCLSHVKQTNPNVVILTDFPGFNLRLALELKKFYKGKIIYFISPQFWAWREKRVEIVKQTADKVLVTFPFEVGFYRKHGIDAVYVGNPLVKKFGEFKNSLDKKKNVYGDKKIITFLPGTRKSEIINHVKVLSETALQLKKEFDCETIMSSVGLTDELKNKFSSELFVFNLSDESSYDLISRSDLVLTKAGTSTVEAALLETPMIIFYKTYFTNYALLKPLAKIKNMGMVNILSGKTIAKEFIQKDFTKENLLSEARKILTQIDYRESLVNNLKKIRTLLGDEDASTNAAQQIKKYLIN